MTNDITPAIFKSLSRAASYRAQISIVPWLPHTAQGKVTKLYSPFWGSTVFNRPLSLLLAENPPGPVTVSCQGPVAVEVRVPSEI
jgi:hypothetical protein